MLAHLYISGAFFFKTTVLENHMLDSFLQPPAMELPPWLQLGALFLASVLLLKYLSGRHSRRRPNLPPGPRPWPIVGNLTQLGGAVPWVSLSNLSDTYGPLMFLRLGTRRIVVGSSVDMAKLFLKTHDHLFTNRPARVAGKYTAYNYKDMVWAPYGAYWRLLRKLCLTELFSARRLQSFAHIRAEEVRALVRGLFRCSGRCVRLKDHLSTTALSIISRMVLGRNYLEKPEDGSGAAVSVAEFRWVIEEWFALNGSSSIGDLIPWLAFLDLEGNVRRMKKMRRVFERFLEEVIGEHEARRRRDGEAFAPRDMVDVLLQMADDPSLGVDLKRDGLKGFTQDLLAGGTETSAGAIEWMMSELLLHPEVAAKATEELDRVVGRSRWVEEDDAPNLPYIDAIIKESMRVHPAAPLIGLRVSPEDVAVGGYDVPAGTEVIVNMWKIGRDPAIWDAPEEFRPERFVGSLVDVKGQSMEFLPFGAGRRMCPGLPLGMKVLQLGVANLLHGFAWRLPEGTRREDLSMEGLPGLSMHRKVPLEAVAEPRLDASLYGA